MASVHDIAAYILRKQGSMSTWKLQKLVYYSQAWHLVWTEEPLFKARIEAWANGPVVPELYRRHRGQFSIDRWKEGNPKGLTDADRDTVDLVLESYGRLTGRQLSVLTHAEGPWQEAREGLAPTDRSRRPISQESMHDFYVALDTADDATPVQNIDWPALIP